MRVAIIGSKRIDKIREPLESVGVECVIVDNIFKKFNPSIDAVITDTPGIGILKGWIVKKVNNNIPLIYRMRGNYWQEIKSEGKLPKLREFIANKLIFRLCDCVVVVNHHLKKEFQKRVKFENVAVVGLPIDVARFKFTKSDKKFNVVTLTNFNYWEKIKPIFSYLDTVDKFLKEVGGKWYIAGKGKYVKDFLRLIEKYETVEYCGYVKPEEFLKKGSVMLHFSEFEGLPNAVLEGMAAGLPVIVNDYEPLTEISGIIVVRNQKELEEWLHETFTNPALRRKMGVRNIKYINKIYMFNYIGTSYKNVITNSQ